MNWNELLEYAGIEVIRISEYDNDELIYKYKKIINELGYIPSIPELENLKFPYGAIKLRYKNYNNFIKSLGINPQRLTPAKVKESDEDLLKMYIEFSKKIGKFDVGASCNDLDAAKEIYNSDVFIMRFGSMTELKTSCGFKTKKSSKKYTKEEIKTMLLNQYNIYNRKLTNKEIQLSKELPAANSILRYFKTTKMSEVWKEVLEEAN